MSKYQIIDKKTKKVIFETEKEEIRDDVLDKMITEGRDVEVKEKKTIIETMKIERKIINE